MRQWGVRVVGASVHQHIRLALQQVADQRSCLRTSCSRLPSPPPRPPSAALHPVTPYVLNAQPLFNLPQLLSPHPTSHTALLPALLSLLVASRRPRLQTFPDVAKGPERELVHRLVVQALLLCVVERRREV